MEYVVSLNYDKISGNFVFQSGGFFLKHAKTIKPI